MSRLTHAFYKYCLKDDEGHEIASGRHRVTVERLDNNLARVLSNHPSIGLMHNDIVRLPSDESTNPDITEIVSARYTEQARLFAYTNGDVTLLTTVFALLSGSCYTASPPNLFRTGEVIVYHDGIVDPVRVAEALGIEQDFEPDEEEPGQSARGAREA